MPRLNLYQEEFHPSPWQQTWLAFKASHIALAGLMVLASISLLALLAPVIAPHSPLLQNPDVLLLPPVWDPSGSLTYLLGTDALGRDIFSRLLYAARTTLITSVIVVVVAMLIGVTIGAIAGMLRGVSSSVVNHLLDSLMAIPTLLIAIVIVAIMGSGLVNSMWAITLALIPQFVHYTRNYVGEEMKKDYIRASQLDGSTKRQLFFYSILPNMLEMLVVQGTLALSIAVLDISALGFLNLGAHPPSVELGALLASSIDIAYLAPWNVMLPGLCIFFLVLSINIVGDGLRSAIRKRVKN
ncbi:ABC transporter permease subunit [Alteromonas sediminis]|uniref:ABC transporter permease subunit n=1 Tax=Alteromonas sediminis TaxID=2259342 RepID=A0A3N5XX37_9ALTE|nr:ABC transporter permease subunit [Alteromonas sediminis]RPJ65040.1 ABC transporter permease subunit [Alteromonas sediminis]